jgi:hypothetical protein
MGGTIATSSAFGNYQRHVIRLFGRAELPKLINDRRQQPLWGEVPTSPQGFDEPLLAELLS